MVSGLRCFSLCFNSLERPEMPSMSNPRDEQLLFSLHHRDIALLPLHIDRILRFDLQRFSRHRLDTIQFRPDRLETVEIDLGIRQQIVSRSADAILIEAKIVVLARFGVIDRDCASARA